MTVSTTSIGANTAQITISGETSSTNVLQALDAAIVNGGWEQYDVYNQGTQRIYRSLCKDGITFKYFGMFFDPVGFKITTTSYETWDKVNHIGTNEVATYNRTGQMHYTLSGCDIIVMISPRWLVLQTFIRNQPGPWAGVLECSREAAEDTPAAGFPPFMWVSSVLITTANNNKYASFPRSRANGTGVAATADGWQTQYVRLGAQTGLSGKDIVPMTTYAWDPSKKIIQSMRPTFGSTELHGKVFGLKAVSNIGSPYARVTVPIDSDYQFSVTGNQTEHWVMAPTPGSTAAYFGTNAAGLSTGLPSTMGSTTLPGSGRAMAFTGTYYYIATSVGVCKVDGTTATLPVSATNLPGVSAVDHRDVIFDGQFIYASSPTGVTRIDTLNGDAVTTLALPQGADALFFDGSNLWAGARGAMVNNLLYRINSSNFTLSTTITIPTTSTTNSTIGGMTTDFAGTLFVSSGEGKLFKVVIETNTASLLVNIGSVPNSGSAICSNVVFNGSTLDWYHSGTNRPQVGSYTTTGVNISPTVVATMLNGNSSTYANATSKMSAFKMGCYHGVAVQTTAVGVYLTSGPSMGLPSTNDTANFVVSGSLTAGVTGYGGVFAACDGGRFYMITGSAFIVLNNLSHPDDGPTAMNRFLLPK